MQAIAWTLFVLGWVFLLLIRENTLEKIQLKAAGSIAHARGAGGPLYQWMRKVMLCPAQCRKCTPASLSVQSSIYPQILKYDPSPENCWFMPAPRTRCFPAACQMRRGTIGALWFPTQESPPSGPWPRYGRPLCCPSSCSAYDNIKLLSLAGLKNEPSVPTRIIKEPQKIDAVLDLKNEAAQTNEFLCLSFLGCLLSASPKATTSLSTTEKI